MISRLALVLFLSSSLAMAKDKPKGNALIKQILAASTVAVVVYPENDAFPRRATFEDRRVQAEVEQKMRAWKRFIFVNRVEDADIVVAVRTGALAKPRVGVETGTARPPLLSVGSDFGTDQDMLAVYRGHEDVSSAPLLWRDLSNDGLRLPTLPALERLKAALEKEEKLK
jgi:hypothetical protein